MKLIAAVLTALMSRHAGTPTFFNYKNWGIFMRLPIAFITSSLLLSACVQNVKPLEITEFTPHGRFQPTMSVEQAALECQLVAEQAGRQAAASGLPGTLPTIYGPAPGVNRAIFDTLQTCMAAKGYLWTTPR